MLGWLWRMLVGTFTSCQHKWQTIERINVFDGGRRPVSVILVLECERCGDISKRKIGD